MGNERFKVSYELEDGPLEESNVGILHIEDTLMNQKYRYNVLANSEENELFEIIDSLHVYTEDPRTIADPEKFNSGEELMDYVDDYKKGEWLYNILSSDDYDKVTKHIKQFNQREEPIHIPLSDYPSETAVGGLIASRVLTNFLMAASDKENSLDSFVDCANVFLEAKQVIPKGYEPVIEKELTRSIKEQDNRVDFETVEMVLEVTTGLGLDNVAKAVLSLFDGEEFDQLRYSTSIESQELGLDGEELATIKIKDRWAEKEHSFTLWQEEFETLSDENIENGRIGMAHINVYDTYTNDYEPQLLEDFFGLKESLHIEKAIIAAYLSDKPLNYKVEKTSTLSENLKQTLVATEIGHLQGKAEAKTLTKNDLVSFSRTLNRTDVNELEDVLELKGAISQALKKTKVLPNEKLLLTDTFEKVGFEKSFFKQILNKNKDMEMVRG